jgi:hypothetical protein
VSDIFYGFGNAITDNNWMGKKLDYQNRGGSWPNQGMPGGPTDHSPYHIEHTGIFSLMKMVEKICQFYSINEGLIEIACDGLSANDKAFSYMSMLNVDDHQIFMDLLKNYVEKGLLSSR